MRIDHIGLWASDLEAVRAFYETYFGAVAGPKYTNSAKGFESYFLTFPGGNVRLEVMRVAGLGGASASGIPARAASRWNWANTGVKRKAGKRPKRKHVNAARAAATAGATRVSLSAYRRR